MTIRIGDDVQVKVGRFTGVVGRVMSEHSFGRLGVSMDGAVPKPYSARSLRLVRAAAHIGVGDAVARVGELDGPRGRVMRRGAMRVAVSWGGLEPISMDIRQVVKLTSRTPADVAAEVAANPGPIVRDGGSTFVQCGQCRTKTSAENLAAHEATHASKETELTNLGPIDKAAILRRRPIESLLHSGVRCGVEDPKRPGWLCDLTEGHAAADYHAYAAPPPPERPEGRVYPIGRPEGDTDPRFTVGLWVKVVDVIEAAGYPRMSGADAARVQAMLFRFIYDKGE
jgi:hypothetical protein